MKLYINKEWQIIANTQELRDLLKAVKHQIWECDDKDMENSPERERMAKLYADIYMILEHLPWE